jgi:hypothetical protein
MTIDSVAPSERNLVLFAAPYLEVESQPISSLERTIVQELAQLSHAAKRKKRKRGDEPSSMRTRPVAQTRFGALGGRGQSVSM